MAGAFMDFRCSHSKLVPKEKILG